MRFAELAGTSAGLSLRELRGQFPMLFLIEQINIPGIKKSLVLQRLPHTCSVFREDYHCTIR
jgi:hypothetical protein